MKNLAAAKKSKYQRGLSIVEILVVIIILLFGVLSIIKVYPAGFLAMHNSTNTGRADRMDYALLDQAQADGSLPDGVYVTAPPASGSSLVQFDPTQVPTDLGNVLSPSDGPNGNNINKARYIYNEKVTIPTSAVSVGAGQPSFPAVVLKYGPIYLTANDQAAIYDATSKGGMWSLANLDPTHLSVLSMPWTEQDISGTASNPPSDGDYDVDRTKYENTGATGIVYAMQFPQRQYAQYFYVDITSTNGTVTHYTLTIPPWQPLIANQNVDSATNYCGDLIPVDGFSVGGVPSTVDMSDLNYFSPKLTATDDTWSTIKVTRIFTPAKNGAFSTGPTGDPYEFTLPNANVGLPLCSENTEIAGSAGGAIYSTANFGVLWFNPLIASTLSGQNAKALVSYTVYDWHIIHEDHTLIPGASNSPSVIDLAVSGLKAPGDVEDDGSVYESVVNNGYPIGGLYILNLDTGEPILNVDSVVYNSAAGGSIPTSEIGIDYRAGKVTLPSGFANTYPHVRFYYQTSDDLAVALERSPISMFKGPSLASIVTPSMDVYPTVDTVSVPQVITAQPTLIPQGQYYISNTFNSTNMVDYVLFPPSMAGEHIECQNIDYLSTNSNTYSLGDVAIDATVSSSTITVVDGGQRESVCYADITQQLEASARFPRTAGMGFSVGNVTSNNTQAFCIWHENGKWKTHTVAASSD